MDFIEQFLHDNINLGLSNLLYLCLLLRRHLCCIREFVVSNRRIVRSVGGGDQSENYTEDIQNCRQQNHSPRPAQISTYGYYKFKHLRK